MAVDQGKSAFVRELLGRDPEADEQAVNEAWQKAGNQGTISNSLVYKIRSGLGLTGKGRSSDVAAGRPKEKATKGPKAKPVAPAQTAGLPAAALNRYEPSERGSEWFANESLDFRGSFRPAFGVTADYAHAPYVLLNPDGSENTVVIENTTYLHVGAAFVMFQRLRVGLNLPIAVAQNGHDKTVGDRTFTAPSSGGVGDLRIMGVGLRQGGEGQ
jgi:hypothetical protein